VNVRWILKALAQDIERGTNDRGREWIRAGAPQRILKCGTRPAPSAGNFMSFRSIFLAIQLISSLHLVVLVNAFVVIAYSSASFLFAVFLLIVPTYPAFVKVGSTCPHALLIESTPVD